MDDIVDYASWDGGDVEIITAVSNITEYLVNAMDNIPPLNDLFDPNVITPISATLGAMRDYAAAADPAYADVVSATEYLISDLASLIAAADDCGTEAEDIKLYIQVW